jgi:glycosyltransferase involved in cell wall biosynthesis
MKIVVSIIIPVRTITPYLRETMRHLKNQSFKNFETIVITDEKEKLKSAKTIPSGQPGPAYKRNLAAGKAKGKILAFLDDDSYPSRDWLKNALKVFAENKKITAVCGPCLTPPKDSLYQKASGWVSSSWFGSGGAGTYRNRVSSRREVDDFPSVNLLVHKKDFLKVGGFDVAHWPGEDTKLCLDLTHGLKKKIIYDPGILAFHHRRPIFTPHLKQISRYARRRGFFAKKFPETSNRFGYWAPTLFVLGLLLGGVLAFFSPLLKTLYFLSLSVYLLALLLTGLEALLKEKNPFLALLVMPAIFATHFYYGFLFPLGYFQKDLGVVPHRVDKKSGHYLGG